MKRGKSMAMLLSAAMLVTTLSPLTAEAAEGLTNQVLDLSFDNSLKDPAGAHGVTMGKGTVKATLSWERRRISSRRT